jgi:pentose-5-phosphate-3-epimerase
MSHRNACPSNFFLNCVVGFKMFEQTKRLISCSHEAVHSKILAFDLVFELYVTCRMNCLSFHFELEHHGTKSTESPNVRCQTKFRACV